MRLPAPNQQMGIECFAYGIIPCPPNNAGDNLHSSYFCCFLFFSTVDKFVSISGLCLAIPAIGECRPRVKSLSMMASVALLDRRFSYPRQNQPCKVGRAATTCQLQRTPPPAPNIHKEEGFFLITTLRPPGKTVGRPALFS